MKTLDVQILVQFNKFSRSKPIHYFMSVITHVGDTEVSIIFGAVMLFLVFYVKDPLALQALKAILLTQVIVQSMKRVVHRIRPYEKVQSLNIDSPPKCQYSFPSGHTASAFTIALGLGVFVPFLQTVFFGVAVLVGLSRIILGYHYPTDVVMGFLIAYLVFIFA